MAGRLEGERPEANSPPQDFTDAHPPASMTSQDIEQEEDQPAALAVFETYELLEQILLGLPIPSLYTLQRVSKTSHSVIKDSKALQKRMCQVAKNSPIEPVAPEGAILNPYFPQYRAPALKMSPMLTISPSRRNRNRNMSTVPAVADLQAISCSIRFHRYGDLNPPRPQVWGVMQLRFSPIDTEEHQSWMNVPICDPPVTEVLIWNTMVMRRYRDYFWKTYRNEKGLTLGDLYRLHQEFKEEHFKAVGIEVESWQVEAKLEVLLELDWDKSPSELSRERTEQRMFEAFVEKRD